MGTQTHRIGISMLLEVTERNHTNPERKNLVHSVLMLTEGSLEKVLRKDGDA